MSLTVTDDGAGMAAEPSSGAAGISGMRERALLVGGVLSISSRPDHGTVVSLRVPCDREAS